MPRSLLSTLMITGAQSPEKAAKSSDLADQFGVAEAELESEIEALQKGGYVLSFVRNDARLVYLTLRGIIAASSIHS